MTSKRMGWFFRGLVLAGLLAGGLKGATPNEAVLGTWALTLPNGAAGWLEIKKERGWFDGSLLWGGGSVLPLASVTLADGVATVTRVRSIERKDASGQVVRTQQLTETLTARADGDTLHLTRVAPRANGTGFDREELTGKRIPPLPPRPDLKKVRFGSPVTLFNGRDLSGWSPKEADRVNSWLVERGVLVNRPPAQVPGQARVRTANLRTDREFEDFNLKLEVNVPEGSNSGIYLQGIYEVQILDSWGRSLDSHHMGAIYSRITPSQAAEKRAGEWQSFDITLVDRHVTVVLNGRTIVDNQPLAGVTGGALWSDQFRPGPLFFQGDHGPVSFRNIVLRPVVK